MIWKNIHKYQPIHWHAPSTSSFKVEQEHARQTTENM